MTKKCIFINGYLLYLFMAVKTEWKVSFPYLIKLFNSRYRILVCHIRNAYKRNNVISAPINTTDAQAVAISIQLFPDEITLSE